MTTGPQDTRFMRHALTLAGRGLGRVAPNPAVGCVIVQSDVVVGTGWTRPGGRPHAETVALEQAGSLAKGATAYVTLEPCAHHGETGPCAEALVTAGIKRVVYACADPDPRVSGGGKAILEVAGIAVDEGLLETEARALNAGFLATVEQGRPLFSLKAGMTLDARIATRSGESKWITGERARAFAHHLRATHDAIMIGSGTALADDPTLDCRLPGLEDRSPIRIVLDSSLKLSLDCNLVRSVDRFPLIVVTGPGADGVKWQKLEARGVRIIQAGDRHNITRIAGLLAKEGITRVLVEGGGDLHGAMMKAGLADRLYLFSAPSVIGGDGKAVIGDFGTEKLEESVRFRHTLTRSLGNDRLDVYERT